MAEKIKIAIAALIAAGGLFAFHAMGERALVLRLAALLGAFAAAAGLMWFTENGRTFATFARESWEEAKRVVWPTRKETMMTALMVVIMTALLALFFFGIDSAFSSIVQMLLGLLG